MNDQFPPYDSYQGFGDVDNGYAPAMPSPHDPYIFPPPIPHPPHPGPIMPIQLKDLMRYIGDVNELPRKPNSHIMAKYAEYGNRIVQYGDVVRWNDDFYLYGYNKARTELEWISFCNDTSSIAELSTTVLSIQNALEQTYRKNQTSSSVQLDSKFNSLSNDFALKSELTAYATKKALAALDTRVARNEIFIGSHEDRLCCHAKKIDNLAADVKSLSDATSSYVTWDDFSSKTTSAEVSAIVEGYNFAKQSYVDEVVSQTSSSLSNDLTAQFNELVQGLASDADLKKLSGDVITLSNGTNASIGELFGRTAHLKRGVDDLYNKVTSLETLCATVDSKFSNVYLEINNTNNKIDLIEQSLQNYVKLSALNDIVLSVVTNANSINCLTRELFDVKLKVQDNAQHIEDLTQDLTSFEQEVDRDYAKKDSLSAYVEKTQFNGTSDYGEKVYPVKLCADNNAYVNVPWNDKFVESAWYEPDTQIVWVEFTDGQQLSICISGLVDIYTAGYGLALSSNEFYVSADYVLRPELAEALSNYYTKAETSSAAQLSDALYHIIHTFDDYYKKTETSSSQEITQALEDTSQVFITDADAGISDVQSDLYIKKVNAEDFYAADSKLSNTLYILTGDVLRAYGMRITDVAEPEDADDAATKQYVDDIAEEEKIRERAEVSTVSSDIINEITNVSSEITATVESTSSIITADVDVLQKDRDYISSWISSNFENTSVDGTVTVLKHEVSATQDLSVADNTVVGKSLNVLSHTFNVELNTSNPDNPTKDIVGSADFVEFNINKDYGALIRLDQGNAILCAQDGIYLNDVFVDNIDKATATALSANTLSVSSFSSIVAEDVSCSVADLCVNLSTDISTLCVEFADYKQNVNYCVSEISAVNILTSSNIADFISSVIKIKDIVAALSAL